MISGERGCQSFPQRVSEYRHTFAASPVRRLSRSDYPHLRTLAINQTEHHQSDSRSGASSLRRCAGRCWRWCRSAHRIDLSRHHGNSKRKAEDRHGAYLA